jgi:L-ribulokinase
MGSKYTIGLDFGTNSLRALLVDVRDGTEIVTTTYNYPRGESGVVLDRANPLLARQDPQDYIDGIEVVIHGVVEYARKEMNIDSSLIIGIGIDVTASTIIPLDELGEPLSFQPRFQGNIDTLAWLWKDHTANDEAEQITSLVSAIRPAYLRRVGGSYSSEWFWSKVLHCAHHAPEVFELAKTWVEACDWIPALLTGDTRPLSINRNICAAGHKGLYDETWGGWPDTEFLSRLDPGLPRIISTFQKRTRRIGEKAGVLCEEWAYRLGLKPGIAISIGSVDAHTGAIGAGIGPGILVKILGTSGVDMMVASDEMSLKSISGFAGIIPDSILPGCIGIEAGQSALGDIYQWFTDLVAPGGTSIHTIIQSESSLIQPGQSGLLSLDWHNGNRTILMDQRLSGLILGLNLKSTRAEIYRSLIEATAYANRIITEHFESAGLPIKRVIVGGGIALRSPMIMQIFSDILKRPLEIAFSSQTSALGASIAAAVAAGASQGGYDDFSKAQASMVHNPSTSYFPNLKNIGIYDELFLIYKKLHDSFGRRGSSINLFPVMKSLISLRERTRGG